MPRISASKYLVNAGWDDVPHLDEQTKSELLEATPPFLRDARTKGIPSLGAGAIYPVVESSVVCDPFEIPEYWPRCYGLDVGWKKTAAVWGAWDRDDDVVYIYTEHYRGQAEPAIHAAAINARGTWIPGVIDPASRGRGQKDGEMLFEEYEGLGLTLDKADNAVEAGIHKIWMRLSTGRLKIFSTCQNWFSEYRLYRRNENGKVVKEFDHLMDATRYMIASGLDVAEVQPMNRSSFTTRPHAGDQVAGY